MQHLFRKLESGCRMHNWKNIYMINMHAAIPAFTAGGSIMPCNTASTKGWTNYCFVSNHIFTHFSKQFWGLRLKDFFVTRQKNFRPVVQRSQVRILSMTRVRKSKIGRALWVGGASITGTRANHGRLWTHVHHSERKGVVFDFETQLMITAMEDNWWMFWL